MFVASVFADPKPLVECTFVTEFEDHIFITMDAESILFIHDLITSYLREKDKGGFTYLLTYFTLV